MQTLFNSPDQFDEHIEVTMAVESIQKQNRILRVIALLVLSIVACGGTYLYFNQPPTNTVTIEVR